MRRLEVTEYGIQTMHHPAFLVERPQGHPTYLVMCFSTPFHCRTTRGIETGSPGDCVIHDLSFPQQHGTPSGVETGFRNDWVHVRAGRSFPSLITAYHLLFNTLIHTGRPDLLTASVDQIAKEYARHERHWTHAVSLTVEQMVMQISRYARPAQTPAVIVSAALRDRFVQVRMHVRSHLDQAWTVPAMASRAGLSASRFSALHTQFFGISPAEDLIRQRIFRAKELLTHTDMRVGEVSALCGFSSIYYFSRLFRRRVGCPPREYR